MSEFVVPRNFSISKRALEEIERFVRSYPAGEPQGTFIAGLCWAGRIVDGKQTEEGPGIGIVKRSEARAEAISSFGDIELLIDMLPEEAERFIGKELDFVNGYYCFST